MTMLSKVTSGNLQGGQNFFEHIRTKIRTFSEENRTIFEKQSVQSVQFFFKKSVQSVHFFKNPYIFLKNLYNQYNFRKNPIFEKKHIKIQFFIHCLLCSVHLRGFKLLQQESICKKLASYIYTN